MTKARAPINLRAYQMFEAVARHRSLTRAAAELGITQGAVSHQMRGLAQRLGEPLIERRGKAIVLTAAGARFARTLGTAFDIIEEQVTALEESRAIVRLGVYSSFAVPWLIARLPAFHASHPDIDLRLVMLYDPHELTQRIADIFVSSEPERAGYWSFRLGCERLVPVGPVGGAPGFAAPRRLVSAEVEPGIAGRAWEAFAALNGVDLPAIRDGGWLCCSHYVLALEMVRAGIGAALLPDFMVEAAVAAGDVLRLEGAALPTGQAYAVHMPVERRHEPAMATVGAWLSRLAAQDPHMSGPHEPANFS